MPKFDWYVHGLWLLGSIFLFLGSLLAGNVEWVLGTELWSFALAVVVAFVFILLAGICWISSAVNARKAEK